MAQDSERSETSNARKLAGSIIEVGKPDKDSFTKLLRQSNTSLGLKTEETSLLLDELTLKITVVAH